MKRRLEILLRHLNPVGFHNDSKRQYTQLSSMIGILPVQNPLEKLSDILKRYLGKMIQQGKIPFYFSSIIQRYFLSRIHYFNMIEILIAISIIVTFSGLTGVVIARKYEESKEANAKLDLVRIQDGLTLYFTKNNKYPLDLEQLLEYGDLSKVPVDPWGNNYVYVPYVHWSKLNTMLNTKNLKPEDFGMTVEILKRLSRVVSTLPETLAPMDIITMAAEQPFAICVGTKIPRFPSSINVVVSRDKVKMVAQWMKTALEKSSAIPELHDALKSLISYVK